MRVFGTRTNCWYPYSSVNNWCPNYSSETEQQRFPCWMFAGTVSHIFSLTKLKFKTVWLEENGREEIPKRRIWGDFVFWKLGTNVVTKAWLSTPPSFCVDTIWSSFTRGSRKNLFECFILIFVSINSFGYVDNLIQNNPLIGYKK